MKDAVCFVALIVGSLCGEAAVLAAPPKVASDAKVALAAPPFGVAKPGLRTSEILDAYLLESGTVFVPGPAQVDDFGRTWITIPDPHGGAPLDLVLRPYSVRAEDFVIIAFDAKGREVVAEAPPPTTVRGMVDGDPGSRVAGSLVDGRLTASIRLGDGRRYFVESLAFTVAGVAADEHVVYDERDRQEIDPRCGVSDDEELGHHGGVAGGDGGVAGGDGGVAGGTLCDVKIAVDADFSYFMATGATVDSVAIRVEQLINIVSDQYERETGIRHLLTGIVVRTTTAADPYTTNSMCVTNGLESQVKAVWTDRDDLSAPFFLIRRKMVHLFTGRVDPTSSIVGCAFVGDVCLNTADAVAHGASRAAFTTNTSLVTDLIAHEMGHNWGAGHCTCAAPPSTMNPTIMGANTFASSPSAAQITAWRDGHSWCLGCGLTNDGCGDQYAGSAWIAHNSPYAYQASCCARVCAADVFCGNIAWDASCADMARTLCAGCGNAATGSPFTARTNPGCSDAQCCGIVCGRDPYCCDTAWDQTCVQQSQSVCYSGSTCLNSNLMNPSYPESYRFDTTTGTVAHNPSMCGTLDTRVKWLRYRPLTSGMNTLSICTELVEDQITLSVHPSCGFAATFCSATPTSCAPPIGGVQLRFPGIANQTYYIRVGVNNGRNASGSVTASGNSVCQSSGSCAYAHPSPGCSNAQCCVKVCTVDPFCCDDQWDIICQGEARDLCYHPADANFDGVVNASDLSILLGGWGGGGAGDVNGDGVTNAADLTILLANWG